MMALARVEREKRIWKTDEKELEAYLAITLGLGS